PLSLSAANYYFGYFISGNLAVTPAPLTVTADDKSREFGTENPEFTGSIEGLQNNDSITIAYSTDALKTSPLGRYVIDIHLIDPTGRLSNYIVTRIDGVITVTKPITETLAFAPAGFDNQTFSLSIQSVVGVRYSLESTDSLTDPDWTIVQTVTGDGGPIVFTDPAASAPNRYYRILIQQ
ncbi:MAG: hypothetical protein JWM99_1474, partial [Verrucomicrobiales bacterium]|nr:hypothetical protein [Verrucomicrobiales bacterium]